MNIESLKLVYFSPTGTTKKIIEAIARGIGHHPNEQLDITKPKNRNRQLMTSKNELILVGVPVYFGRAQENAINWLKTIKGNSTPAVCVVVYGNREYDDSLLELKEIMTKNGFIPIACAAYIGEHSFSNFQTPIAAGRPDAKDILHAESFGVEIRNKIESTAEISLLQEISVPGKYPFIDMAASKKNLFGVDLVDVGSQCVQCGGCALVCPVGAIDIERSASVDKNKCILCHACVKHCPTGARTVKDTMVKNIALRMSDSLQNRKEPRSFM